MGLACHNMYIITLLNGWETVVVELKQCQEQDIILNHVTRHAYQACLCQTCLYLANIAINVTDIYSQIKNTVPYLINACSVELQLIGDERWLICSESLILKELRHFI